MYVLVLVYKSDPFFRDMNKYGFCIPMQTGSVSKL
jgi:hypothetical protein